jgi:hypothetical protein
METVFGRLHLHEPLENARTGERLAIEWNYYGSHIKEVTIKRQPMGTTKEIGKETAEEEEGDLASPSTPTTWVGFTQMMNTCQAGHIYLDLPLKRSSAIHS